MMAQRKGDCGLLWTVRLVVMFAVGAALFPILLPAWLFTRAQRESESRWSM